MDLTEAAKLTVEDKYGVYDPITCYRKDTKQDVSKLYILENDSVSSSNVGSLWFFSMTEQHDLPEFMIVPEDIKSRLQVL